jgi:hypothetical protein
MIYLRTYEHSSVSQYPPKTPDDEDEDGNVLDKMGEMGKGVGKNISGVFKRNPLVGLTKKGRKEAGDSGDDDDDDDSDADDEGKSKG